MIASGRHIVSSDANLTPPYEVVRQDVRPQQFRWDEFEQEWRELDAAYSYTIVSSHEDLAEAMREARRLNQQNGMAH